MEYWHSVGQVTQMKNKTKPHLFTFILGNVNLGVRIIMVEFPALPSTRLFYFRFYCQYNFRWRKLKFLAREVALTKTSHMEQQTFQY